MRRSAPKAPTTASTRCSRSSTASATETGSPPLASPIGEFLASQAIINVLAASRYLTIIDEVRSLVTGGFGTTPGPIDPALDRVVQLTHDPESEEDVAPPLSEVRERAEGMAASEEELLLLGLFGDDAERLLRSIRSRGRREDDLDTLDDARAERIREVVNIVQESGIGELTIEEEGMRISVRSTPDAPVSAAPSAGSLGISEPDLPPAMPAVAGSLHRVESPMVGTFYRSPSPDAPAFVSVGDSSSRARRSASSRR